MIQSSRRLYFPTQNSLSPLTTNLSLNAPEPSGAFSMISSQMQLRNYPCVAALQSFASRDFLVGIYEQFGANVSSADLRQDLLYYLQMYQKTKSQFLSFWAIYDLPNPNNAPNTTGSKLNEDQFETALWQELMHLTSAEDRAQDRDPRISDDPTDVSFCLSIGGQAFFVVGLHPNASRISRRFPVPALIFNVFEQFDMLEKSGGYEQMVKINRARDLKLQNSINPMVEKYGDHWESIQFSGKENHDNWRCPFRYRSKTAALDIETP